MAKRLNLMDRPDHYNSVEDVERVIRQLEDAIQATIAAMVKMSKPSPYVKPRNFHAGEQQFAAEYGVTGGEGTRSRSGSVLEQDQMAAYQQQPHFYHHQQQQHEHERRIEEERYRMQVHPAPVYLDSYTHGMGPMAVGGMETMYGYHPHLAHMAPHPLDMEYYIPHPPQHLEASPATPYSADFLGYHTPYLHPHNGLDHPLPYSLAPLQMTPPLSGGMTDFVPPPEDAARYESPYADLTPLDMPMHMNMNMNMGMGMGMGVGFEVGGAAG
ncbi:hypothetical protein B0H13DRAFT_2316643 [Mycena leptocephala]|nr:hypothetical protein B0H13DRAFT_2316643 [Mycena leptocephala]